MNKATMVIRVICRQEDSEALSMTLLQTFERLGLSNTFMAVLEIEDQPGMSLILSDTGLLYTSERAGSLLSQHGYDTIAQTPGVVSVTVGSSQESEVSQVGWVDEDFEALGRAIFDKFS